jgi:phage terminase large subunit
MSKEVVLNQKYSPLFDERERTRYFICTGGRGSGKSFSITIFLVNLTFEYGQKILFTRYTLTSAKTSIIPQFIECLEALGYGSETFEITNDTITNKVTGSQILFKGIKTSSGVQTASLKSLTGITAFVVDEAEELTDEEVFNKIDYSVRVKGVHNRVILIMNPATVDHWIYKRWFTQSQDNTTYIHTTYLDNIDNLNEDIIHKFNTLKDANPKEYEHVVLGGWKLKADGVIFENWETGKFDDSLPFIYGADYGFTNDPSTLIKVAVDEKKRTIYLQECMYEKHLSTEQLKTLYKSIVGSSVVVCDSAEPRLINDLKMSGINALPCVKKGGSVLSGIQDLLGYKMIVCGHSPNLVTELNNYEWIDRGSKTIPIDDHNHLIDPIRYAKFKLSNSFFVL